MIRIYTLERAKEWDELVRTFEHYDVYYLAGYVKAFWLNGDGEPILIYYERGETRAINVVFRRDLSQCKFFRETLEQSAFYDFVTPYGYGGFLVEGTDYGRLQEEYEEFCRQEHIVCEFVRFHPLLENWKGLEQLYTETYMGTTVYMDTCSEEEIWNNITSKNRNMIRKTKKSGLKVYWGRYPELIEPFMEIYNAAMDKDGAKDYYYFGKEFYESILEDLKQNAMWFYAKEEKEIAAIAIFLFGNENMHYHLSASRAEFQRMAPTNLLLYEAALWAGRNGYKKLHMGGGVGSAQDSLYKFKKSFHRGTDARFCVGKKIFDRGTYDELVEIRKAQDALFDDHSEFFPRYRA